MRQGQQHRRGRSRGGHNNHNGGGNNNNRKGGQNPLSRTYQSNGPDGKVSGTADGIAAKYLSLARDATSSGDPVLAENYLQHAEHYNRIILAYRESQAQANEERQRVPGPATEGAEPDDSGDDETEQYGRNMDPLPPMDSAPRHGGQPHSDQPRTFEPRDGQREGQRDVQRFEDRQPRFNEGQQRRNPGNQPRDRFEPRERYQGGERYNAGDRQNAGDRGPRLDRGERYPAGDRQPYMDRQPRDQGFDRPERPDRPERMMRDVPGMRERDPGQPRFDPRPEARLEPRPDLPPREIPRADVPASAEQPVLAGIEPVVRAPRAPRRERAAPAIVSEHEQPEFLRRPVRRPRREPSPEDVPPAVAPAAPEPTDD